MGKQLHGQELCKFWRICCVSRMLSYPVTNVCCRLALQKKSFRHMALHPTLLTWYFSNNKCALIGQNDHYCDASLYLCLTDKDTVKGYTPLLEQLEGSSGSPP